MLFILPSTLEEKYLVNSRVLLIKKLFKNNLEKIQASISSIVNVFIQGWCYLLKLLPTLYRSQSYPSIYKFWWLLWGQTEGRYRQKQKSLLGGKKWWWHRGHEKKSDSDYAVFEVRPNRLWYKCDLRKRHSQKWPQWFWFEKLSGFLSLIWATLHNEQVWEEMSGVQFWMYFIF